MPHDKSDAKFEEKLAIGFENDMRNLVNFNASSGKSENLRFAALHLSKVCNVLAKTYRGVVLSKMTWFQK